MYDVIIVGAGPAGLNAALILGRCRRRVLVCDAGAPRNAAARHTHGFLTRDGIPPGELLALGRQELVKYGVEVLDAEVATAECLNDASEYPTLFEIGLEDGRRFQGRKLLLATGIADVLPSIPGFHEFYGRGVHHCPYCDGWEYRDQPLVSYGYGHDAVGLALSLHTWSDQVTACTHGGALSDEDRATLEQHGIAVRTEPIDRLEGTSEEEGALERIVFREGPPLPCRALFFNTAQLQQSELALALGCERNETGQMRTRPKQRTDISGLYLAGDADGDVQFLIVAAAEGATAAVALNHELQKENRERRERGVQA